jgi:hypothetical protein
VPHWDPTERGLGVVGNSHLSHLVESFMYERGKLPKGCEHEQASMLIAREAESVDALAPNSVYREWRCGRSSRWSHDHPGSAGEPHAGQRAAACWTFVSTLTECEHG